MFSQNALSYDELEEYLKNQLEAELKVDAVSFAATWLEEGAKVIFAPNIILMAVQQFKQSIPLDILNAAGSRWNFFDGIAGYVSAYYQFQKLPEAKRRKKEKTMWAAYELSAANILNASAILTLLAQHGVLQGLAATASSPLNGIAFAAIMWGNAIHSYINLYRAVKKSNDPVYLFEDYLIKIENIKNKIQKFEDKLNSYETDDYDVDEKELKKINKIHQKIEYWKTEQERLQQQAILIAQVKFDKQHPLSDQLKDKFAAITKRDKHILEAEPTSWGKKIVEQLEINQKEKIEKRAINSMAWTTAAIGMTLIAISPFSGPAAPAVAAAGIAIAAIAGAIKLGEVLVSRAVNTIAKHQQNKKERVHLLTEYVKSLNSNDMLSHLASDDIKLLYRLSYEHNKQVLIKNNPGISENYLEKHWYEQLDKMDLKQREKLLNMAEKKSIEDRLLGKILGLDPVKNEKEFQSATSILSKNEAKQIINRECRMHLNISIKHSFSSLFSHQKNETREIDVNKFGHNFNHE